MKLTQLEPQFIKFEMLATTIDVVDGAVWDEVRKEYVTPDGRTWDEVGRPTKEVTEPREHYVHVDTLAEAQGIWFLCPKCFQANNGSVGTHHVMMPFAGRAVDAAEHEHQWNVTGSGYDDLSATPSYLIIGGCGWHGWVKNGVMISA